MTVLTDYATALLTRSLCGRKPALPNAVYAGLGTGGANATGLTGEPAGNGYARQAVAFTGSTTQQNTAALNFAFSAPVGALTHLGLFDAPSGGNALTWSPLSQPVAVSAAGTVTIPAAALTISAI